MTAQVRRTGCCCSNSGVKGSGSGRCHPRHGLRGCWRRVGLYASGQGKPNRSTPRQLGGHRSQLSHWNGVQGLHPHWLKKKLEISFWQRKWLANYNFVCLFETPGIRIWTCDKDNKYIHEAFVVQVNTGNYTVLFTCFWQEEGVLFNDDWFF